MRTHLVVVSVPVISHQIAISEFCKRLLQLHPTIRITFIIPVLESLPNASKSIIVSLSALDIETITLPPVNLPQEITVPALKLPLAMSLSLPSIHDALKSITSTSHVVAIVADYFAYELLPFAKELKILSYVFFPTAATIISLCLHSSTLHETISCEYKELQEPIKIPGTSKFLEYSFETSDSFFFFFFFYKKKLHLSHNYYSLGIRFFWNEDISIED